MDQTASADEMWLNWVSTYKAVVKLQIEGYFIEGIAVVNHYLDTKPPLDLEGEALGCRASLHEDMGNLEEARRDLIGAHFLSAPGGYSRYTLELSLGDICERLLDMEQARQWYGKALSTVAVDPLTSGGAALRRLARLTGSPDGLTLEEREICVRVAVQSWKLLGLEGEPDLHNLARSAEKLLEAEARISNTARIQPESKE